MLNYIIHRPQTTATQLLERCCLPPSVGAGHDGAVVQASHQLVVVKVLHNGELEVLAVLHEAVLDVVVVVVVVEVDLLVLLLMVVVLHQVASV